MNIGEMIDRYREYDVEYYHQFTNHLPMALIALHRMGATEERMEEFASIYIKRLRKIEKTGVVINRENWKNHMGEHTYYYNYVQFFTGEFDRLGKEDFLKSYLNELLEGVAAGAFHALIKTAYGLMIDDKKEIIDAVSYFAISYLSLAEIERISDRDSEPTHILREIREDDHFRNHEYRGKNIFEKMKAVSVDPHFKRKIRLIEDHEGDITGKLADSVLKIFANSFDFTALHAVTATHALRMVTPYILDRERAVNYFWIALCAAYITCNTPPFTVDNTAVREGLEWEDILRKASQSNNEHVIKLVYSCYEENKRYKNPRYIITAAKEAELF